MYTVMQGVRVLEVAQFTFVPAAGAVLADWGADVLKVEHPVRGDSQRGLLRVGGQDNVGAINFLMEHSNRGKRSIGIDLANPEGRELLYEIAKTADVFLTNYLPGARRKLQIEVEHIRAANPDIIYARGSALGDRGPEREQGGYDSTAYWARGGSGMGGKRVGDPPSMQPGAAYGDSIGGMTIAGGIAGALFARERTGKPSIVDISLVGTGVWSMGAFLMLTMLQGHPYWADTCEHLGRPDLAQDPRFATAEEFAKHSEDAVQELRAIFATATLEEWRERLAGMRGQWGAFQTLGQVATDAQVLANGHIVGVDAGDGTKFNLVASPVQFDEQPTELRKGPEHAQHTEEVLMELGLDWDRISELKRTGAIN
jgi:crotonobetainyl-CoA:carnitine CoA-transferase CaiB-like acyl-CoA transferase